MGSEICFNKDMFPFNTGSVLDGLSALGQITLQTVMVAKKCLIKTMYHMVCDVLHRISQRMQQMWLI
jgi:hypothetical protein